MITIYVIGFAITFLLFVATIAKDNPDQRDSDGIAWLTLGSVFFAAFWPITGFYLIAKAIIWAVDNL